MSRPSLVLVVLALCVVGLSAWFLLRPQHSLPDDPLAAVPSDAYGVLAVRVDRLLASQAWQQLVVARGQARGIERAIKTCGFNPLAGIEQLTVFVQPADGTGSERVAFTARGNLKHERLIDCARKLSGRGGLSLTYEEIEGIHTVRSSKGKSRIALLGRDGIAGGNADSVRDAIHTLLGKRESLAKNQTLHELYEELHANSDLTAVAQSPARLLPLVGALGWLPDPGVLALDHIEALGARVSFQGELISGGAAAITDSPARASAIAQMAEAQRERILQMPLLGLTGLGGPLRSAQIDAKGARLTVAGSLRLRVAEALLDLLGL